MVCKKNLPLVGRFFVRLLILFKTKKPPHEKVKKKKKKNSLIAMSFMSVLLFYGANNVL